VSTIDATRGINLRILRYLALHPDGRSLYQMKRDLKVPHQVATTYVLRLEKHGMVTTERQPMPSNAGYRIQARLAPDGAMAVLLAESSRERPQPVVSLVPG
jgi:DNA-binding IclR family transcriptional regulator